MRNSKTANLYALCETAILISIATILACYLLFPPFRIDIWVFGGSIDFVMVPLILIGWRRGLKWSIPACLIFGFLKCILGGNMGYGILSILIDYVLAYGMVGLAGIFKGKTLKTLIFGTIVATIGRLFFHFLSGITIWKIAAGEVQEIFGMTFDASKTAIYSLLYNGSFMLGEFIYCLAILIILYKPLTKAFKYE